ncbi:hypothetical protein [Altererythrobacter ishigakiensis]|uniref:Uncharacterized protein n=1 Tax=Altererythrobacter ishigakiensis TaxID=476157 RepID=A0A562ULV4_9SPHN|nr:hypothetical protein [Altererythrobacter ishigakiensis]TWJ06589.1 hypothetical protein JN10_2123 [Altererythrobacter ishigakiensis]
MQLRILALAAALTVSGTAASEARAQAAAEEAVVLSGTSAGTSRASRDLGNAVGGSIRGATRAISTIPRAAPRGSPRRSRGGVVVDGPLAADSDPLENTNAPAYQLSNGATIRVSGGMRNSASAKCKLNCLKGGAKEDEPLPSNNDAPLVEAEETEATRLEAEASKPD